MNIKEKIKNTQQAESTNKEQEEFIHKALKIIKRGTEELINETELAQKIKFSAFSNHTFSHFYNLDGKIYFETKHGELILIPSKPLIIKAGFDPTAPDIHLGHTVLLRKLKHFQNLGHTVVLLVGDFTAMIGDPTGKSKTRKRLSKKEVEKNAETYTHQVFKILDKNKTKVVFNSEWCGDMSFAEVLELTSKYTLARILERDDFQKRYQSGQPISMIELMYPLIQGYDSVELKADVELGGTDQKFNMLVGRQLMRESGQPAQVILTLPLLEGLDGEKKMSKSLDNYIGINESPKEMFGKIMSLPDKCLFRYFNLLTDIPETEIKNMEQEVKKGANPRDFKIKLAKTIISDYHPTEMAEQAEEEFKRIFAGRGLPNNIPKVFITEDILWVVDLIAQTKHLNSNGEIRRLIKQGGIKIDDEKIADEKAQIKIKDGSIIKIGKRGFYLVRH